VLQLSAERAVLTKGEGLLLEKKVAVIYGGAGPIGSAVARAFAREGARVFLAGRTPASLEKVTEEISSAGGTAETAQVDALDEHAVDEHADDVVSKAGSIDVSFNAIGHQDVHGAPLVEMPLEDALRPIDNAVRSKLVTARAAARHMTRLGSGVIMTITATTARLSIPNIGGTGVAFDAIESLYRQLARELGPHGIRVLWLQTTGIAEAIRDEVQPDYGAGPMTRDQLIAWNQGTTMLGRLTSLADISNAAVFLASDQAGALTATGLNLTSGQSPTR
jgi:3-oxoacyl-[acyl-carrier protein] reductase